MYNDDHIGLGHRRLAVIDLTEAGHEPMFNEEGNVVLVYNGEIYNFQILRSELEHKGHVFSSATDAEVVVHAYEEWGDECVGRFNGTFAYALWDLKRRRLVLARDRYGAKPLYYLSKPEVFLFGSEIKPLLIYPGVSRAVSYAALSEYFTFQNLFTDRTLFEDVFLLQPGCLLVIEDGARVPRIRRYWDYAFPKQPLECTLDEAATRVHDLFIEAVTRQLVSDVPIGVYLSGGMDSGSIMAVAAKALGRLRTFTCGFDLSSASGLELAFDERKKSETLANLYKSEHYEVVLHAGDMEAVMPELIWYLEDLRVGQCYPNYYIARLASRFVKVALCGAGGDELFGGYPWRYFAVASASPEEYLRDYYNYWQRLVPDADKPLLFNDRTWRNVAPHSTVDVFRGVFDNYPHRLSSPTDFANASFYFELKTFLHGLLVVEDRIAMAHGLEVRVPFLDNDLVDLATSLPPEHKVRALCAGLRVDENGAGKRQRAELQTSAGKIVLREAMKRLVPSEITEQMKQGFSAPDASWFRGESIEYIRKLLLTPDARIYEYMRHEYVSKVIAEHTTGAANRRLLIWSLLSFEWWLRLHLHGESLPDNRWPGKTSSVTR
jgi:asparagine synthase (glutamine-hydrolysing)